MAPSKNSTRPQVVTSEVADEIHDVREEVEKEIQALETARNMLQGDYLRQLVDKISALEMRLSETEFTSGPSTGASSSELKREQERLAKLWDAYKAQEDELLRIKRDYPLMEEKLFERDRTIQKLRREIAELNAASRYKSEYQALLKENERLKQDAADSKKHRLEARKLRSQLERAEEQLARTQAQNEQMSKELDNLRAMGVDSTKLEELELQLEEEQERLAKLYAVYEELEGQHKEAQDRLRKWEAWFAHVAPAIEDVAKAPSSAPRS